MGEKKEMTMLEMQEECLKVAIEISKLESIKKKHLKRFDELNYKIWQKQKESNNE